MRNIFHELHYAIRIFFLNPIIFLRKFFNRIFLFLVPWPKDKTQVKIGEHIIQTQPSRNLWRKSICFRQCDIEIEDNLKKYLSPSGVFIDAGAGIGYFSAIASDIVGGSGKVHCFEPNPFCGESITKMIKNSPNSNIIFNNCALGNYNGSHKYYIKSQKSKESTIVSMVEGVINNVGGVKEVRVQRLDDYLEQNKTDRVSLIKIDVEGYEYFVLQGLSKFFEKTSFKPPIICEIFTPAYKKPDLSLERLESYMKNYGYRAYNIFNPRKKVDICSLKNTTDVVFKAE